MPKKWTNYKSHQKLVNPSNKRRLDIIVVGTGLAGASAATWSYWIQRLSFSFRIHPSATPPRGSGRSNAAKNYHNDVIRFFDFLRYIRARIPGSRSRCLPLGLKFQKYSRPMCSKRVPFAREYVGMSTIVLWRRSVSRTFYAKVRPVIISAWSLFGMIGKLPRDG
jgi:succinate dehydrogenase / fumarate reductase flavoprotein subunit